MHRDAADVTAAFGPMVETLRNSGYERTVPDHVDVRVLNDRAATVEAHGDRIDGTGAVMHRFSGFFFVVRTDEGWRIVAVTIPTDHRAQSSRP